MKLHVRFGRLMAAIWLLYGGLAVAADATPISTKGTSCLPPKIDWRNYEWILITGNGKTACEEMLSYLKGRSKEAPPPVCPNDRLPPNGHWTLPKWKVLSEAQRQELLQQVTGKVDKVITEWKMRQSKVWKTTRIDITKDGLLETLLAYGDGGVDCQRATQCAVSEGDLKGDVVLSRKDDNYEVFTMDDTGARVDLSRHLPLLDFGSLIYYKGRPYWISPLNWIQSIHDDYIGNAHNSNPKSHYNRIFQLAPLGYRSRHGTLPSSIKIQDAASISPDQNATCHFGYFHRDNLKRTGPLKRR